MANGENINQIKEKDEVLVALARSYLSEKVADYEQQPAFIIESYTVPNGLNTLNDIYFRLLISATNRAGMNGVQNLDQIQDEQLSERLRDVFYEYYPQYVLNNYNNFEEIAEAVQAIGFINAEENRKKFCKTAFDGANFLADFPDVGHFREWCNQFDDDVRARAGLALIIKSEIREYGFALACDFLKEIGFVNFGKPDRHIVKICRDLKLAEFRNIRNDDRVLYDVFKTITRISDNCENGITPFAVDRLLWLTGSGYFFNHRNSIGNNGIIPTSTEEFINYAREQNPELFG